MPELNKGFVPFSQIFKDENVHPVETIYDDEVGNDYNPHGWNTSKEMHHDRNVVSAYDANHEYREFEVIEPFIDFTYNNPPYRKGVWNPVDCDNESGGVIEYTPPIIGKFETNSKTSLYDITKTKFSESNIDIQYSFTNGTDELNYVKLEIYGNGTLLKPTIELPKDVNYGIIKNDTLSQIDNIDTFTELLFNFVIDDGKQMTVKSIKLEFVYPIYYGSQNTKTPKDTDYYKDFELDHRMKVTSSENDTTKAISEFFVDDPDPYVYIISPKKCEIYSIGGGFKYTSFNETVINFDGMTYYAYILSKPNFGITLGFSLKFI